MTPRTPKDAAPPFRRFGSPRRRSSGVYPCEAAPEPVAPPITGDYAAPPVPQTPVAAPTYGELVADVSDRTEEVPLAELQKAAAALAEAQEPAPTPEAPVKVFAAPSPDAPSPDATVRMPALGEDLLPVAPDVPDVGPMPDEEVTVRGVVGVPVGKATVKLPPGEVARLVAAAPSTPPAQAVEGASTLELPPGAVAELVRGAPESGEEPVDPAHEPTEEELDAAFGPKFGSSLFDHVPSEHAPPATSAARPSAQPAFAAPSDETGPHTMFGYEMKQATEAGGAEPSLEIEVDLAGELEGDEDLLELELEIEVDDDPISEPPIPMGLPRLEAALAWQSESQLWTGLDGELGIFLATYAEIAIGEHVELHVHLPGEPKFVTIGTVRWVRDTGHGWPGLGLQIQVPGAAAYQAIARFAAIRPPLFV